MRCAHLRTSIDEEHSGVLLSRLQIVRFVHHPIERKPRGALEGEHFWGNVIRKRACHGKERRVWFNREWMNNAALLQPCPSPISLQSQWSPTMPSSGCGWDQAVTGNTPALGKLPQSYPIPIPALL